jgi:Zn-dependent protease with chaperone function/type II secretory pathway pseudopilin PulG
MNDLVYPHERTLGAITLIFGILVWLGLIVGTFGTALITLAVGFIFYLFIQSTLIAHIKGNGVELTEAQFPDLYAQFAACCERLQMKKRPRAFILNGNGGFNAFATRFLGVQYVVLLSDIVDAMSQHEDGVRFYIGHELGHLRMKHLSGNLLRLPVLWLPLLGAAYSRARESTCDRHGLACSGSPEGAARALSALAAGGKRWREINVEDYCRQAGQSSGFWMSFHELIAGYPWLTKRVARVMRAEGTMPRRNVFAWLLAVFVPYMGRLGGGFGFLILVYIIGMFAAIAIPSHQKYAMKAREFQESAARTQLDIAVLETQNARDALSDYYRKNQRVPESLSELGISPQLLSGNELSLDPDEMALTVTTPQGELIFTPSIGIDGRVIWVCTNGDGLRPEQLPPSCRSDNDG